MATLIHSCFNVHVCWDILFKKYGFEMNPNIVDSLSKFTYFRMFTFEHYEVMRTAGGYKLNVENPVGSSQY